MQIFPNKSITAIVLTFNEEQHIERCINSLKSVVNRICIIDSNSTDKTTEIAKKLGAEVFSNPWKNYATQFKWGMNVANITSEWTMRIDADEYLEPQLQASIEHFLESPGNTNAVYFRRKIVFLGRHITHGFFYPEMMLRLWKTGHGVMEEKWMDEHIIVENAITRSLEGDLADENLNDLSWWTRKHIGYADREVYDIIAARNTNTNTNTNKLTGQARRKRFLKNSIYLKLPTSIRSFSYFFYRYILGRGFLDGKAGFFFHFLQAFWYRTLVDAKLYELEKLSASLNITPAEYLEKKGLI